MQNKKKINNRNSCDRSSTEHGSIIIVCMLQRGSQMQRKSLRKDTHTRHVQVCGMVMGLRTSVFIILARTASHPIREWSGKLGGAL